VPQSPIQRRRDILRWCMAATTLAGATICLANEADQPATELPASQEIRDFLVQRVDVQHQACGMVVGVIDSHGSRVVSYGFTNEGSKRAVDGDTVFEIGSITKIFTSILLADAAVKGEMRLGAPVAQYLSDLHIPERGRAITLEDLAEHISGLPRDPAPIARTAAEHFANFNMDLLRRFLDSYTMPHDVGAHFEYSNIGFGILGLALQRGLGDNFEDLVRKRITGPLRMHDTGVSLTRHMSAHLSPGHDSTLAPVPATVWSEPYLAAGSMRSTANDLLRLLAAELGYRQTALAPAFAQMLAAHHVETGFPGLEAAIGWSIATGRGSEIVTHSGITAGFTSFIAYEPGRRVGVVVLSNTFGRVPPDDIGLHIINPRYPLADKF
jgi:serine-type D-Ala-D-Ala carboxypeptidase/endopeptidase